MNSDNIQDNKSENNNTDAVLNAFSQSLNPEDEFKKRWEATVEAAKKRREERLRLQQEKEKLEEERKIQELHPRVANEQYPGMPLNLSEIEKPKEKKPVASKKEAVFEFNENEYVDASKEYSDVRSKIAERTAIRDRSIKKGPVKRLRFAIKSKFSKKGISSFFKNIFPRKGDSKGEVVRKIVRDVSGVALLCAVVFLATYGVDYMCRIRDKNSLLEDASSLAELSEDELSDAWAKIKAQYPDVDFPEGMNIKWAKTYSINQGFVGWLKIENTKIDTAILQTDNNSYYLKHNMYDEYTRFGNPFANRNCDMSSTGLSRNTILYGHNANDGLMFHDLINYMTVEGYKKAPIVTFDTLFEQTKWKIFAVVLTNSDPADDNNYVWDYLITDFSSEDAFNKLIDEINERTIIHTGVDIQKGDKILTLYTCCTYQVDSGRLAVFARQLRDGESEEIDFTRTYYNSNAHYPQAWYDRRDEENPFAPESVKKKEKSTQKTTETASSEATEQASETQEVEVSQTEENTSGAELTSLGEENTTVATENTSAAQEPAG